MKRELKLQIWEPGDSDMYITTIVDYKNMLSKLAKCF